MLFPLETYRSLESHFGKDLADQYVAAFELGFEAMEHRVDAGMTERKLQVRDDLLREVATKSELQQVKAELRTEIVATKSELQQVKSELRTEIQQVKSDLDSKFHSLEVKFNRLDVKFNFVIALLVIALTLMNPAVAKLVEHWLKL